MDIPQTITFNGTVYRLMGGLRRYYLSQSSSNEGRKGAKSLHVAIWEQHNGARVPSGHVVHHRDGNPFNNDPGNLECLSRREHGQRHADAQRTDRQLAHLARIQPLAAAWHHSEAGHAWHKDHAKSAWVGRQQHEVTCVICGETFMAYRPARYCSSRCHERRATAAWPVQTERRQCVVCGKDFEAIIPRQRSRIANTCGRSCRGKLARS